MQMEQKRSRIFRLFFRIYCYYFLLTHFVKTFVNTVSYLWRTFLFGKQMHYFFIHFFCYFHIHILSFFHFLFYYSLFRVNRPQNVLSNFFSQLYIYILHIFSFLNIIFYVLDIEKGVYSHDSQDEYLSNRVRKVPVFQKDKNFFDKFPPLFCGSALYENFNAWRRNANDWRFHV